MSDQPDASGVDAVLLGEDDRLLASLQMEATAEADRRAVNVSVDLYFYVFLRRLSRFGYFTFGPLTIDVRLIGDLVERTGVPRESELTHYGDDFVRFSRLLADEARRSSQRHIDELHLLLAFMRVAEGLPARVFGELGVSRDQVEEYAKARGRSRPSLNQTTEEKLYSPEEAAAYLGVHVQTVRAWIRSGRLKASRLTGQRALRIAASDLHSVLEPVAPEDVD